MMSYESFEVKQHGRIAQIIFNRPEEANALIPDFWDELPRAIEKIDGDSHCRVIVISSRGRHFSSGLHLSMLNSGSPTSIFAQAKADNGSLEPLRPGLYERILRMQKAISSVENCRLPVIAAIQGACIGGGVDLVTACCMRYASDDAYFSVYEVNIGVVADVGTFPRLANVLPAGLARELAYTGRKMFAPEAQSCGFVNRVVGDHEQLIATALEVAAEIASKAPLALYGIKRMANYARDHSTADCLDYVALWNSSFIEKDEVAEVTLARAENRDANHVALPKWPSGRFPRFEHAEDGDGKKLKKPLAKKSIDVLGTTMAYHERGEGNPILFLHGNPTSSFLWRDVLPSLEGCGHLIAPDLIGMGDSGKLSNPGPETYRFRTHREYLAAFIDAVVGPTKAITLVIHDWGSALGFDWANHHRNRVRGIAYMEALVRPFVGWEEWNPAAVKTFQGFRSEKGEEMVLDRNMFIERVLTSSLMRRLSNDEMDEYRRPFPNREDRWPMLSFPREIPISGEPADVAKFMGNYSLWMAENEIPKLFINADPGVVLVGPVREFCRGWRNQTEVTVPGAHYIQEDSGPLIGQTIANWLKSHSL